VDAGRVSREGSRGETETQIQSESLRYCRRSPGRALGYTIGQLKILELREKARSALGDRFDIRRFHDAVLGAGPLPFATLERHVGWFIEQEKKRTAAAEVDAAPGRAASVPGRVE
jgi:uncharacterized protein (DUF885 family)